MNPLKGEVDVFRFCMLLVIGLSILLSKESLAQKVWTSSIDHYPENKDWKIFGNEKKIIARLASDKPFPAYYTTSNDGIKWTSVIRDSANTTNVTSIVWTGTQFVGIGYSYYTNMGFFAASPDGISWSVQSSGNPSRLSCLTWTGVELMAGDDSGSLYTSQNGANWVVNKAGIGYNSSLHRREPISFLTYTGSLYFAKGNTDIFTSSDGKKWTRRHAGGDTSLISIIYNGTEFFAFYVGGVLYTSPNGVTWTGKLANRSPNAQGIYWDGSRFVALGRYHTVLSSGDGINWIEHYLENFPWDEDTRELTWNGKQFYVVGVSGSIATSGDASTWTMVRMAEPSPDLYSIAAYNSQSVAVGARGAIYTSPDGYTWSTRNSGTNQTLRAIAWTGTEFITVGDSGTILASSTGETWTKKSSGTLRQLNSIDWAGNQYLVGGTWGTLLTSPDGNTWTARNSHTNLSIKAVKSNGTSLVAVGDSGLILTSLDGVNWDRRFVLKNSPFYSLVWTGYQFVAAGGLIGHYQVYTSIEGVHWEWADHMAFSGDVRAMTMRGNEIVALFIGSSLNSTFVRTSKDGITWSTIDKAPIGNSIAWTGSKFILVGKGKTIYTSPLALPTEITMSAAHDNNLFIHTTRYSLSITLPADLRQEKTKVCIYNLAGHRILQQALANSSGQISIPLPEISKGRYLLEVTGSKRKLAKTFCLIQ